MGIKVDVQHFVFLLEIFCKNRLKSEKKKLLENYIIIDFLTCVESILICLVKQILTDISPTFVQRPRSEITILIPGLLVNHPPAGND